MEELDTEKLGQDIMKSAEASCLTATSKWDDGKQAGHGLYVRAARLSWFGESDNHIVYEQLCEGWVGGNANRDQEAAYRGYSAEKFLRTGHGWRKHNHISSQQSIEEGLGYLGAHVFKFKLPQWRFESNILIASSGLPQQMDEGINVHASHQLKRFGWHPNEAGLSEVLRLSDNQMYQGDLLM